MPQKLAAPPKNTLQENGHGMFELFRSILFLC